jgi:hypothetical protein
VKTTIDLPDDLLTQAKVYAAQHKTTLKELVMQGLQQVTAQPPLSPDQARHQNAQRLIDALQARNTEPMKPMSRDEIYDRHKGR